MKKRIRNILFIMSMLLVAVTGARAGVNTADSLLQRIYKTASPAERLNLISSLCEVHKTYASDTFYKYANEAVVVSKALGSEAGLYKALYFLSVYYYSTSKLDSASYILSQMVSKEAQDKIPAYLRNRIGLLRTSVSVKQNKLQSALRSFYSIMTRTEAEKDTIGYLGAVNGIGWVYLELGKIKEAKEWLLKGIRYPVPDHMVSYTANCYNNIIACYGLLGQMDSAQYYIDKALIIADKCGDQLLKANTLNLKADLYIHSQRYSEAIALLMDAIRIRRKIGDPFFIVSDLANLADAYCSAGQFDEGIKAASEGLEIAREKHLTAKLPLLYTVLYRNYNGKKDYKRGAETLLELLAAKDSFYRDASAHSIAEMQVKYKTAEKEKTIQQQQFALVRKNYWLYGSLVMCVLTLLLAFVGYRSYRNRQKINLQELQLKQQTILTKSILRAEENERKRIAADLHDGLGQMLTAAWYNISGITEYDEKWDADKWSVLGKVAQLIDESCKEIRTIAHNIMPNNLLNKGFAPAVQSFLDKIDQAKLAVHFNATGMDQQLSMDTQVALYRIIQEGVNNIIRHANATKADISVMNDASGISLSIEDNGRGFDSAAPETGSGMGLQSIRTRTAYLMGKLEIDTRTDKGTLISIYIPKTQPIES
jgi:signal transduction histidine kinase